MAILFRWLMRAVLATILLAGAAAALAYYLADQSLPDYNATWTLEGPSEDIEIVRDRYAVPHILSSSDRDAFFGLGFVHAQDRLWQMTLLRRTVQGRVAACRAPRDSRFESASFAAPADCPAEVRPVRRRASIRARCKP